MTITPRSRKQKGSRHERKIASYYRTILGIDAKRMPLSGGFSMLKGDIIKREHDGWMDECKNQETVKLWEWWDQARSQCGIGSRPVLHITRNNAEELTVIRTHDYFNLRKEIQEGEKLSQLRRDVKELRNKLFERNEIPNKIDGLLEMLDQAIGKEN